MINIVSTSGGRTSMYLAIEMRRRDPNSINVFMDTGAEHPETYRFLAKCNELFGLDIICIKAVIPAELGRGVRHKVVPMESLKHDNGVMTDYMIKNGTPVSVGATCSDRMKTLAFRDWVKNTFDKTQPLTSWLGMRIDEPRRLTKRDGIRYLADISEYDKSDILQWWAEQPVDLKIPEHLGNCVFCVKKTSKKIALAARHEPEMYDKFLALVESDTPRHMPKRAAAKEVMYRGHKTLRGIVSEFEDVPTRELERMIGMSRDDQEDACATSCEGDFSTSFREDTQFKGIPITERSATMSHAFSSPSSADMTEACAAAPLRRSIIKRRKGFLRNYIGYINPAIASAFEEQNKAAEHGTYLHDQQERLLRDGVAFEIEDDFERDGMQRIAETLRNLIDVSIDHGVEDSLFNDGVDSFGTADFWCSLTAETANELYDNMPEDLGTLLEVRDLKTGRNEVHAVDNSQGLRYACGVMEKMMWAEDITHICITIDAFRFPSSSWVITRAELLDYWQNTFRPAMYANNQLNPVAVAGDHCKWCDAKLHCAEFGEFMNIPVIQETIETGVEDVDTEELEALYSVLTTSKGLIDDVKAELIARQEAAEFTGGEGLQTLQIKGGAKRSFISDKAAVAKALPTEVWTLAYKEPELKSPSALRAALKDHPEVLEAVSSFIVDTHNKPSLIKSK